LEASVPDARCTALVLHADAFFVSRTRIDASLIDRARTRLLGVDNVVFTPHVAFCSTEALRERKLKVALGVRAVLERREPESAVTSHQKG
jgi:lactate dehydrogenase-like 2-hydroxyacid dehydrogenase